MDLKIQKQTINLSGSKKLKINNAGRVVNRVGIDEQPPDFKSMFGEAPSSAFEMPISDDKSLNEQDAATNSAMLEAIIAAKKEQRDQFRTETDPNFYFVVCFQNTAQKDEFLEQTKWGDPRVRFIDGLKLAAMLDVDIKPINLPRKKTKLMSKGLREHEFIE